MDKYFCGFVSVTENRQVRFLDYEEAKQLAEASDQKRIDRLWQKIREQVHDRKDRQ